MTRRPRECKQRHGDSEAAEYQRWLRVLRQQPKDAPGVQQPAPGDELRYFGLIPAGRVRS